MARPIKRLGEPIQNEDMAAADGTILPGMLVQITAGEIAKHSSAGGFTVPTFALEREEAGYDIDTLYEEGDTVKVGFFHQGCIVNAIIASGQNITEGTYLESAGDGTLRAFSAGTRLARARETVNNSAGPSYARIDAEII